MSGLRFKNSYIPKINHSLNERDANLHDEVFARHDVQTFTNQPSEYLKHTKVVNFSIIEATIQASKEIINLQKKAEVITIDDLIIIVMRINI